MRRTFWIAAALLLAIVTAENLGTPRNGGPDELAHIVRAAGLVRGHVLGDDTELGDAYQAFDVPGSLTQPDPTCYRFDSEQPADCSTVQPTEGEPISTAASYPIWGHLLPGLGTLVVHGPRADWFARFLGSLPCVALVAAALAFLVDRRRRLAAGAVLLATTPMVLFSSAVVNPTGLVATGAIAVWIGGDTVLGDGRGGWLFTAGFAALVLPRNDGLVWAAIVVVALLVTWRQTPRVAWRALARSQQVLLALVVAAAVAWVAFVPNDLVPIPRTAGGWSFVEQVVGRTGTHVREAIGVLGWLDTPIPETMYLLWAMAAGAVFMIALVTGERRRVAVASLVLGAFIVVPWVLEVIQGRTAGLFWQGRYALPLLIGFVLLCGNAVGADRFGRLPAAVPAIAAVAVWNVSFLQELRRWGAGSSGSMLPWNWGTGYAPVAIWLVIVTHVVASVALLSIVWRLPGGPVAEPHPQASAHVEH